MSAPRTLPPTRARLRLTAGRAALLCLAAAFVAGCGGPAPHVVVAEIAPDTQHAALVRLTRCDAAWCEALALGATPDTANVLATLPPTERCTEIAWSRDGKRVGFVINGHQLRMYNADSNAPAGLLDLVPRDSDPTTRIARGVTFSDTGAAITFDDCPRDRSGCRPGLVALR